MSAALAAAPAQVRVACITALIFLFVLPCIAGRLTTYFIFLAAILVLLTPSIRQAFATRSRNPIDMLFVAAAALPSMAFLFTAEDMSDLLFVFNFAPLLLAIPFRWQLERLARADAAGLVGWLSLGGAAIAVAVAFTQVVILGSDRAGQPIMSPFQFADTAMLLGFLAPAGLLVPGRHTRLLLVGPILAVAAVVLSGTRGALVIAPVLAALSFGFAFVVSKNRMPLIALGGAGLLAAVAALFLASQLGYSRAIDGLSVAVRAILGGEVDGPTHERLVMYAGAWEAWLRSPLVGYGWLDMVPATIPYTPADMLEVMKGFRHLHNGLLSFAVSAGLPGIVSFAILSVAPVVAVIWTPRDAQFRARLYLALVLCATYAAGQLTIIMLGFEFHTVQYAFMTMAIVSFVREPGANAAEPTQSARGKADVGPETAKTA